MKIDKIESSLVEILQTTLKSYINAWHKIPADVNADKITIERIRYVKQWGLKTAPEDAFILEFSTEEDLYRELFGRSELEMATESFKLSIEEQNENGLLFGKSVTTNQFWYEYPIIWGTLDETFDDVEYYEKDGKYESENYTNFGMKYDK